MQEVFICAALRTPFGKLQSALHTHRPDTLLCSLIQQLPKVSPNLGGVGYDCLFVGASNQAGEDNRNLARQVGLLAGLSPATVGITFNSLCTSGIEAFLSAVRLLRLGEASVCLVGAAESMSRSPFIEHRYTQERVDSTISWRFVHPDFPLPVYSMSEITEREAQASFISRNEQDNYAFQSLCKYEQAIQQGYFSAQILPLLTHKKQPLHTDEPHKFKSLEALANFKPMLPNGQHLTLCNTARAADGAVVLVLMNEAGLKKSQSLPLARLEAYNSVGVDMLSMNTAQTVAAHQLIDKHGSKVLNADVYELSDASAFQSLLTIQNLGLAADKVNPAGGAISTGNPTSAGNLRLLANICTHFEQQKNTRTGLVLTCAGLGLGNALFFEKP